MRSAANDKRNAKLERVLTIASELFAVTDFRRVSMENIALGAGVGKGTLYNLFDSKEDLYFSIIKNRLAELLDALERAYDCRKDTLKNLRSLILHLHKFMSKYPHFYLIWKREENTLDRNDRLGIGNLQRRIAAMVHRTLEAGTEEGVVRPGLDHELLTHLLLGMTDGMRKSPMNVHLREKSIDDLLDVLIKGIGVDGLQARVTYDEYHHVRSGDVD
jgi:AcrR family transcriptional regulator